MAGPTPKREREREREREAKEEKGRVVLFIHPHHLSSLLVTSQDDTTGRIDLRAPVPP
jgi:hypothetical protein